MHINYAVCTGDDHYLIRHHAYFLTVVSFSGWVENIVEAVRAANKTALSAEKIRPHMDNLTLQLLALSMLMLYSSQCIIRVVPL